MANPSFEILTRISPPGTTPIAGNTTSAGNFASNYYKLSSPTLSRRDRLIVAIIGLIHTVSANNYKANHKGLIQDSRVYTKGISSDFDPWAALAAIDFSNGVAVDGTMSTDLPTLLNEGRDFMPFGEDDLERIYAYLRMELLT